ncbi:MAG: hypothetical protein AAGA32_20235 [Pseudomonadota bacterium]
MIDANRMTAERCDSFCEDHDVGYTSEVTWICVAHRNDESFLEQRLRRSEALLIKEKIYRLYYTDTL